MGDKICIVISSDDRRVVKTALQYARRTVTEAFMENTKLFLFGPSEEIITKDPELQYFVRRFKEETGKRLMACKWCADEYGVLERLEGLGIKVDFIGEVVSESIKDGYIPMVW